LDGFDDAEGGHDRQLQHHVTQGDRSQFGLSYPGQEHRVGDMDHDLAELHEHQG
jgi:hypothetical protein